MAQNSTLTDETIIEYQRTHKFTRETFIKEITMMHEVAVELKEKPRLKIKDIVTAPDLVLVKAHKFYWDKL